ncbi:MAG: hypothetical protein U0Q16_11600 [Bryobacteraceae bacterium]
MISRAALLLALLLSIACSSKTQPVKLPAAVSEWKLTSEQPGSIPAGAAPDAHAFGAYAGPSSMAVHVLTYSNQAVAFEMVQKARPMPGTFYFQHDRHFVLITSPGADLATLSAFAKAFEAQLDK